MLLNIVVLRQLTLDVITHYGKYQTIPYHHSHFKNFTHP